MSQAAEMSTTIVKKPFKTHRRFCLLSDRWNRRIPMMINKWWYKAQSNSKHTQTNAKQLMKEQHKKCFATSVLGAKHTIRVLKALWYSSPFSVPHKWYQYQKTKVSYFQLLLLTLRFKLCDMIFWSLSAKMCQSCLSSLISHWFMNDIRVFPKIDHSVRMCQNCICWKSCEIFTKFLTNL